MAPIGPSSANIQASLPLVFVPSPIAYIGTWILSHNVHRRHLKPSQRAAIAVEYMRVFQVEAKARQSEALIRGNMNRHSPIQVNLPQSGGRSPQAADQAAEALSVCGKTVRDAAFVKENDEEAFEDIKAGRKTASGAAKRGQNRVDGAAGMCENRSALET